MDEVLRKSNARLGVDIIVVSEFFGTGGRLRRECVSWYPRLVGWGMTLPLVSGEGL